MVLKKQTVWLLTMLSLIIVLSVYYITAPGQSPGDMAAGDKEKTKEEVATSTNDNSKKEGLTSSTAATAPLAEVSHEKREAREELAQKYNNTIVSATTAAKISDAKSKLEALNTLSRNENLLENMIVSKGYGDVVVRAEPNGLAVSVYVNTKSLSQTEANKILNMTHEYLGEDRIVRVVRK